MQHKLIIALGNPGEKFSHTRHNLGQDIVTAWISYIQEKGADVRDMKSKESVHARVQEIYFEDTGITILFPDLFMNDSGKAAMQYLKYNEIDHGDILIIHDDLELALGEVKLQESGSAKGHNGVRSIHEYTGTLDIPRLRIGIGRPVDEKPIEKFVLEPFTSDEQEVLRAKQRVILETITTIIAPNRSQE